MQRARTLSRIGHALLVALAVAVIGGSLALTVTYAGQPPLDLFSFRQTQTAITAYWFAQDGFKLAYETPVGGAPWSIPFEFPIYQGIVALVARMTGGNLDFIGRLTSFGFLLLCLWPGRAITRRLQLPTPVFWIFAALLFSSPMYLYWGRAFMIETAALWFTVMSVMYFLDIIYDRPTAARSILFVLFSCLALLQKVTTGLPILFFMSLTYAVLQFREAGSLGKVATMRRMTVFAGYFVLPVMVAAAWVFYTDYVKLQNAMGAMLTSSQVSKWNWGTLDQRLSLELLQKVLLQQMLPDVGSYLAAGLLLSPFIFRSNAKAKRIVLASVVCGLAPIYIFTNLHWMHSYYQTALGIFLIFGVATALGAVVLQRFGLTACLALTFAVVSWNLYGFSVRYLPFLQQEFTASTREVALGRSLHREIPPEGQFIAFGNDWSSSFSYMAGRKSFTVPPWFKPMDQVIAAPDKFLDPGRFSGVVWCPNDYANQDEIFKLSRERNWKISGISGCLLATPERKPPAFPAEAASCLGSIDGVTTVRVGSNTVLSVLGWAADPQRRSAEGRVFVRMEDGTNTPIVVEAMRVARPDVTVAMGLPEENDLGFSRLIQPIPPDGRYTITVLQDVGPNLPACTIRTTVEIIAKGQR